MKSKSNSVFGGHTFYGSTMVGARGQMVIPIKARRDYKLKNGEEVLVVGAEGKFLIVMRLSEIKGLTEELQGSLKEIEKLFSKPRK